LNHISHVVVEVVGDGLNRMTAPEKSKRQIGFQTKGKGREVPPSRPAS
jgi:hypothetical protein